MNVLSLSLTLYKYISFVFSTFTAHECKILAMQHIEKSAEKREKRVEHFLGCLEMYWLVIDSHSCLLEGLTAQAQ